MLNASTSTSTSKPTEIEPSCIPYKDEARKFYKKTDIQLIPLRTISRLFPKLDPQECKELQGELFTLKVPEKYLPDIAKAYAQDVEKKDVDGCYKSIKDFLVKYAIAEFNSLKHMGGRRLVLTNDGGSNAEPKFVDLTARGLNLTSVDEIGICTVTAGKLAKREADIAETNEVGYFGTEKLRQELITNGLTPIEIKPDQPSNCKVVIIGEVHPRRDWTPEEKKAIEQSVEVCLKAITTNLDPSMPTKDGIQKCLGLLIESIMEQYPDKFIDAGKPSLENSLYANSQIDELYGKQPVRRDIETGDMHMDIEAQYNINEHYKKNNIPTVAISNLIESGGTEPGQCKQDFPEHRRPTHITRDYRNKFNRVTLPVENRFDEKITELQTRIPEPEHLTEKVLELHNRRYLASQETTRGFSPTPSEWSIATPHTEDLTIDNTNDKKKSSAFRNFLQKMACCKVNKPTMDRNM